MSPCAREIVAAARALLEEEGGVSMRRLADRLGFAFAHGMVVMELDGRFPDDADLDAAWARGLSAFAT